MLAYDLKSRMEFEWDAIKARANERKHGISFFEASEVFGDDYSSCTHDPDHSHDEERYLLFGVSSQGNFLVVSYVQRGDTIRIISARRMTRQERNAYEQ
ncbi:BrnT family toxin [Gammaproteobacteria bacterium]